jgi:hypothetical protein
MFDALNKASDEKELRETARIADERAQAELARRRSMEDTRLRLDIDKAGYRITDPTAERGQDDIVVGPSPIGGGVLTRTDPLLKQKRKNTAAFTRLQARDPEKWREPVEDFDYDAAEVQELAIDELSTQLNASGMFKAMNPAQLRAIAANTMNKNPEVRGLMERAVKAQMPEAMSAADRRRFDLEERRIRLLEEEAKNPRGGTAGPVGARVPISELGKMQEAMGLARLANELANLPEAKQQGTGPVYGRMPADAADAMNPAGGEARRLASALAGKYFSMVSGAAVSESEATRLEPFVPNPKDRPERIREKAAGFARELETILQEKRDLYRASGYYVPDTIGGTGVVPQTVAPPPENPEFGPFTQDVPTVRR